MSFRTHAPAPAPTLSAGSILGDYVLEEALGSGAQGAVWRARHRTTGEAKALKLLKNVDPASAQALVDEGQQMAKISSKHVAKVERTRVDIMPPHLIMELVAGESLLDYISGGDGTPIECVAPKGIGDGTLPAGITIDKTKCTIAGSITETRYGTYAWIVRARQSGVDVFAPYCATQDKQAPKAYTIIGNHSGKLDNELEPLVLATKADQYDPRVALRIRRGIDRVQGAELDGVSDEVMEGRAAPVMGHQRLVALRRQLTDCEVYEYVEVMP